MSRAAFLVLFPKASCCRLLNSLLDDHPHGHGWPDIEDSDRDIAHFAFAFQDDAGPGRLNQGLPDDPKDDPVDWRTEGFTRVRSQVDASVSGVMVDYFEGETRGSVLKGTSSATDGAIPTMVQATVRASPTRARMFPSGASTTQNGVWIPKTDMKTCS